MPAPTASTAAHGAPRHPRDPVPPRVLDPLRHVATLTHHDPHGDALVLLTCTCRRLRTVVDVDDPRAVTFVLWEHLEQHAEVDHLLVDDLRTDRLYALTRAAAPSLLFTLNPPRKDAP